MRPILRCLCGLTAAVILAAPAFAQTPEARDTVAERRRPELDPPEMRLGAFVATASLTGGYTHDDNIFATDSGEVSDNFFSVMPRVAIESGWSRHGLSAEAEMDVARYSDEDSEDYEDWRIGTEGFLDLARGRVSAGISHADLHEPRTSPNEADNGLPPAEPNTFTLDDARLDWLYAPGRISVRPALRYRDIQFDDNATTNGTPIDNGDRDRSILRASVRPAFRMTPDYGVFVELAGTRTDYDQDVDDDGFERSSDGQEYLVGATMDLGGKAFGEAYLGYRSWEFDDPRYTDIDGLAFGLDLSWNFTGLTTVTVTAEQAVDATTIERASGIDRSAFGVTVDHELLRNLILSLGAEIADEDFDGIDRNDGVWAARFGAKYMLNRHLYALLGVDHASRDSSGSDQAGTDDEYDVNTFYLRLQGNL